MKKKLVSTLLIALINTTIYCQNLQTLNKIGSTEILLNEKVDGYGPLGNTSTSMGSNDMLDSMSLVGYPTLKHLPDSLTDLKVYTVIMNQRQFCYQNYRNGLVSREYFLGEFKQPNWKLADTCRLTSQIVRNYISVAVGFDRLHQPKYVIDANGNNDFSDDELYTLNENLLARQADNSKSVSIEYFDGKNVMQENILCAVTLRRSGTKDNIAVSFSFPQFRYTKVLYEGELFYICTDQNGNNNSIYILPDRPNFQPLTRDKAIEPNQYLTIGDVNFRYEPISQNLNRIRLIRENQTIDKKASKSNTLELEVPSTLVSAQVGKLAPEIKGLNVWDGSLLSLTALRGKYVFLDFWFTACGPCIMEFPYIRKVYDTFSSDQLIIIGVVEDDYNRKIKQFMTEKQVFWPTIVKSYSTTNAKGYNIPSWPTSFLIDPDGKIITTNLRGNELFIYLENLKIKKK
jgi:thiol-disulfide isomerase/thioredoxin